MMQGSISVALCTYNGERYLREQLESIAAQTRLPDALVVVDDQSHDRSVAIAREFARGAPFPVEVVANAVNLGYARNFEKAIGLVPGEVVVLSDQDDVWDPAKLQRIEAAFATSHGAGMVFTDAHVVDAGLRPLGYRLWDVVGFTRGDREAAARGHLFRRLLRGNVVTGATMAFHHRWRELVLPVDAEGVHDAWIALLVSAVAGAVPVSDPLIRYRQHAFNQIGVQRRNTLARLSRARQTGRTALVGLLDQHRKALQRLSDFGADPGKLEMLRDTIAHLEIRIGLRDARLARVAPICRELLRGRYRRGGNGMLSAFRDLIV